MAINLNPGADPTIAGAAARAGMALAPTDYGATFRDFSTKYQAAMATVGETWNTVAQTAGLKVAQIKESANKIRDNYGTAVTDVVFDDTKDLARQRFDIMKGYSGSYVKGEDGKYEWVRGPKFSEMDDPKAAKAKAKQDWRNRKDARFNQLRQMEQNVYQTGQQFVTNNVDVQALNPGEAAQVNAIMNAGEYTEDGIRAEMRLGKDGLKYEYVFYDKDDKPISGFNEVTGAPMYVDKSDLRSDEDLEKMARTNVGLHSDRITLTDAESELIGHASNINSDFSDPEDGGWHLDPNNWDDWNRSQMPEFLKKYEVDEDGFLQKIGQHQPGGVDDPGSWDDWVEGTNAAIAMLLQGVPPDEVFSKERMTYLGSDDPYTSGLQILEGKTGQKGMNLIVKGVQKHLHKLGYDLGDSENYKGGPREGIDGKWGKDSQAAFELFKKDQEEAKRQKSEIAGGLWSDISAQAEERTPLTLDTDKLSSLFTTKDVAAQEKMNAIGLERGLNSGLNTNLEFDENQVRQDINNIINDAENPANTLKHLMYNTVIGMEHSFKDYLTTPGTVYSEAMWQEIDRLGQMGLIEDTSGPGGAPDGKYTVEDFKDSDAANFNALAKEMLNPNNPKAKELYIDFLTNGVRSKFDAGRTAKGKGKNDGPGQITIPSGVPSVGAKSFQGTGAGIWTPAADVQGIVNRLYSGTIDFKIDGKAVTFTRNEETNWWDADGYESISGTDVVAGLQVGLGEGAYAIKNHSAVIPFLEDRRTAENVETGIVDNEMIVLGVNYGDAGDWVRDGKTGNFYKKSFGNYKQAAEGGNIIYANKGAYKYDDEVITKDSHLGQTWAEGDLQGQAIVPQYDWGGKIDGNWLNKKQAELLAEILKKETEVVKSR